MKKWQEHSFVSDNAREDTSENRSDKIDQSESIKIRKRL